MFDWAYTMLWGGLSSREQDNIALFSHFVY